MAKATLDLIRHSSLFRDVRADLYDSIRARAVTRAVEEGGYYFMQGDPATHTYILLEGRVKLLQVTPNGQQIVLRIIMPSETFASVAILNPKNGYPVSAQALEDSTALGWETQTLRDLASQDSSISYNTIETMHTYMTDIQSQYRELATERVEQRIARALIRLAAQSGKKVDEGVLIDIPLTRQDIAEMTGTTLYTVSRTLSDWERKGMLKIGRARVVITRPHELVKIAEDWMK